MESALAGSAQKSYRGTSNIFARIPKMVLTAVVAAVMTVLSVLTGIASATTQKVEAFDATKFVFCSWGDDSLPAKAYGWTQTSDLQFEVFSKSAVSFGLDEVNGGLNSLLVATGNNFENVNDDIRGVDENGKELHKFNEGNKYNFFQRFGVAGISYSSYLGEWKHVVIKACDQDPKPQDPKANHFYDTRQDPQSTWDDITNSKDVRTQLFGRGQQDRYVAAVVNFVSNVFLFVSKLIVVLMLSLLSFSFQDVGQIMGIPTLLFGEHGNDGFVSNILDNTFWPLLSLAGLMFIIQLFINFARPVRLGVLAIRYVLCFLFLVIFMTMPGVVASLPLNLAILIQSATLEAASHTVSFDTGLCSTEGTQVAQPKQFDKDSKKTQEEVTGEYWAATSELARKTASELNCAFVKIFVFDPWTQGQFGKNYNDLWVEGKAPSWATNPGYLKNENGKQVGEASVPMGGGQYLNNWAIFQVSTQTNAHIPEGAKKGDEKSKVSSGVSHDWWRVVDAVSNYNETDVSQQVQAGPAGGSKEITRGSPDQEKKPLEMWDTWNGTSPGARLASSFLSMFIALGALTVPGILALLVGALTIALEISVLVTPVAFLFAFGNDTMFEWFKGFMGIITSMWATNVSARLSMMFSIMVIWYILDSMRTLGWWQSTLMFVLLSFAIWKSHKYLGNTLRRMVSVGYDLVTRPMDLIRSGANVAKAAGKTATSGTISGVAAKRDGGSFTRGAFEGAKNRARDLSRRSNAGRESYRLYASGKRGADLGVRNDKIARYARQGISVASEAQSVVCSSCYDTILLDGSRAVYIGPNGEYYCDTCYDDGKADPGAEVVDVTDVTEAPVAVQPRIVKSSLTNTGSGLKQVRDQYTTDEYTRETVKKDMDDYNHDYVQALADVREDISEAKLNSTSARPVVVSVPSELEPYIDASMVAQAWKTQNYDYVTMAMIVALKKHFEAQGVNIQFSDARSLEYVKEGR